MISKLNVTKLNVSYRKLLYFSIAFIAAALLALTGYIYADSKKENSNSKSSIEANQVREEKGQQTDTPYTVNSTETNNDVQALALEEEKPDPLNSDLNYYVLKVISSYSGGTYPYLLNNDYEHYNGVTQNIIYKGALIAKANPNGSRSSHCVGLTYEVFFKAMQERNIAAGISKDNFNNMTVEQMKDFMLTWFVAHGQTKEQGDQLAGAIVKYGLGSRITKLENAKAGDFIDFSRMKSGHAGVFLNWVRDENNRIVGFKYWSTQESTNGIGYRQEYFNDNAQPDYRGSVNRSQLYIGRVGSLVNYKKF